MPLPNNKPGSFGDILSWVATIVIVAVILKACTPSDGAPPSVQSTKDLAQVECAKHKMLAFLLLMEWTVIFVLMV